MYAHRYHRIKKKKRKSAFFPILMVLLILFVLKENTGLWESIKLHGKIACYQNILELYLPGAVYSAKGEVENYQTQVESELSYEDILAREAADENYVDENTLNVHIRRLRQKIEKDAGNPEYVITVFGIGYTFGET